MGPSVTGNGTGSNALKKLTIPWIALSYGLVGVVALLLRVLDLGAFISGDEADFWIHRSGLFLLALQRGDYAATAITTHPGVTTMWLGSAGILLRQFLFESGLLQQESMATLLVLYRLPVVLVHVAGILAGYGMLRRMMPAAVALLAALLWATDPFIVAFSRVLHVDGLAATFGTLSLLAACLSWNHTRHKGWLLLSGACAGLAIVSKSPALVLVPAVSLLAVFSVRRGPPAHLARGLLAQTGVLLIWGLACAAAATLAWPAVWAAPLRVYEVLRVGVEVEGGSPHMMGNFFLGREMDAPGPLFYPVSLVMRATPWVLVGLLLLPLALRSPQLKHSSRDIAFLAGFAILFIVAMSLFPKKFNRYLIPCFPAIVTIAAAGLVGGLEHLIALIARFSQRWQNTAKGAKRANAGGIIPTLVSVLALVAILHGFWWHTYGIAYFSELFGGARAGPRTFVVGWGEGYGQVAKYLNRQPDITDVITLTRWGSSLNAFLKEGAYSAGPDDGQIPDKTGYIVVYIRHVLGGNPSPPFDRFYQRTTPLHTVTIHGVDYAWIYDAPEPVSTTLEADFGPLIQSSGYTLDTSAIRSSGVLTLSTQFQARAPIATDYLLFAYVFDAAGRRVAQIDVPPAGPHAPTSRWEPGRYQFWSHPLPLPHNLPAGRYRVAYGLYNPANFSRLPLQAPPPPPGAPVEGAGPHALFLNPITIGPDHAQEE